MRTVSIDNEIEGHPTYLSDEDINIGMGAVLTQEKRAEVIEFIKSNNGKISQREIARRLGIGKTISNRLSNELGFRHIKYTADEIFL